MPMRPLRPAKRLAAFALAMLTACAPALSNKTPSPVTTAATPHSSTQQSANADSSNRMRSFEDGYAEASPNWSRPDHVVIYYTDGNKLWIRPVYGHAECPDFEHCRAAFARLDDGQTLDVLSLDGTPVLNSKLLQIRNPSSGAQACLLRADNGKLYVGHDLAAVTAQVQADAAVAQARAADAQRAAAQHNPAGSAASDPHPYLHATENVLVVVLAAALVAGAVYLAATTPMPVSSLGSSSRSFNSSSQILAPAGSQLYVPPAGYTSYQPLYSSPSAPAVYVPYSAPYSSFGSSSGRSTGYGGSRPIF